MLMAQKVSQLRTIIIARKDASHAIVNMKKISPFKVATSVFQKKVRKVK